MGAYFYAIFSMIAAGVFLPTMDTKTIMVFTQSALLFIQVTFQGMYVFLTTKALKKYETFVDMHGFFKSFF